jgi:hypothetical protein
LYAIIHNAYPVLLNTTITIVKCPNIAARYFFIYLKSLKKIFGLIFALLIWRTCFDGEHKYKPNWKAWDHERLSFKIPGPAAAQGNFIGSQGGPTLANGLQAPEPTQYVDSSCSSV